MHRCLVVLGASLSLVACTSTAPRTSLAHQDAGPAPAQRERGSAASRADNSLKALDLQIGSQSLDNTTYWEPLEDLQSFAVQYAYQGANAPLGVEFGLSYSSGEEDAVVLGIPGTFSASLSELSVGLHKSFLTRESLVRPYLGAGVSLLLANAEFDAGAMGSADGDGGGVGFYVRGGLPFHVTRWLRVGVEAKALLGSSLDIEGAEGDADYTQLAAFVGFAF